MKLRVHSMTRPLVMAVVFWSILGSAGLLAPIAFAQIPLKIGFVNASIILEKAPQAEEARKRLEEEFDERDLALVEAQKFVRELEDRLIDEGSDMSDGDRRKL